MGKKNRMNNNNKKKNIYCIHLHVSQLVPFALEGHVDFSQPVLLPGYANSIVNQGQQAVYNWTGEQR